MVGRCSGAVLFTGTCDWASCPHCPGAVASPAGGSSAPACSAYLHVEVVPLLVDAAHALQVRAAVEQQLLLLRPRQRHGVQAALPPQRVVCAADCGAEGCRREGSERCLVCLCVGVLQRLEGGPKHRQQLHTPPSQPTGCRRTLLPFNHESRCQAAAPPATSAPVTLPPSLLTLGEGGGVPADELHHFDAVSAQRGLAQLAAAPHQLAQLRSKLPGQRLGCGQASAAAGVGSGCGQPGFSSRGTMQGQCEGCCNS